MSINSFSKELIFRYYNNYFLSFLQFFVSNYGQEGSKLCHCEVLHLHLPVTVWPDMLIKSAQSQIMSIFPSIQTQMILSPIIRKNVYFNFSRHQHYALRKHGQFEGSKLAKSCVIQVSHRHGENIPVMQALWHNHWFCLENLLKDAQGHLLK